MYVKLINYIKFDLLRFWLLRKCVIGVLRGFFFLFFVIGCVVFELVVIVFFEFCEIFKVIDFEILVLFLWIGFKMLIFVLLKLVKFFLCFFLLNFKE